MPEPATVHLTEQRIRELVEQYEAASERRDVPALLGLFADDAVIVIAAGAFRSKDCVRQVLDWDVRTAPVVHYRPFGLGLLIKGTTAVREVVGETAYEGVRYEYVNLVAFEFNEDGKISAAVLLRQVGHRTAHRPPPPRHPRMPVPSHGGLPGLAGGEGACKQVAR